MANPENDLLIFFFGLSLIMKYPPRFVVIVGKDYQRSPRWEFAWSTLYGTVSRRYQLRQTVPAFEIWELPAVGDKRNQSWPRPN